MSDRIGTITEQSNRNSVPLSVRKLVGGFLGSWPKSNGNSYPCSKPICSLAHPDKKERKKGKSHRALRFSLAPGGGGKASVFVVICWCNAGSCAWQQKGPCHDVTGASDRRPKSSQANMGLWKWPTCRFAPDGTHGNSCDSGPPFSSGVP